MYEYTLTEVFEELHQREFAEFDKPKRHIFSLRHRRAMNKILSPNQPRGNGLRCLPPSKRIAVIILLIFLAILTATACTVMITDIMNNAPDKWITEQADPTAAYRLQSIGGRYSYTLTLVGEFMSDELGIDPNDRTFTHVITDEQREWLASRHDIDALKTADSVTSSEFQNFLADLYYLGIFSKSEINEYSASDFDFLGLTGQMAFLVKVGEVGEEIIVPGFADTATQYVTKSLERQRKELYYFETDPAMMENAQNYPGLLESMREIIDSKQEMHDVLLDFFSSFE